MSGHTPGPWEVINLSTVCSLVGANSGDGCKADQYDCWQIAELGSGMTLVDGAMTSLGFDVVKANANLIAAAPDLLMALENLENDAGQIPDHAWKIVKSAIARAKGEQP